MHVSIREARPSDIDAVFALMLELIRAEDDASRKTHESLLDLRVKRDDFARSAREELFAEFEEPNTRFIVAIIDETIVGYARAEVVETIRSVLQTGETRVRARAVRRILVPRTRHRF
jgi:hypothetical protein